MLMSINKRFRLPGLAPKRFVRDQRGVAATEFALIFPVMLALFIGMVELFDVLLADRRVTSVASSTADLVGQENSVDDAMMTDIFSASSAIMSMYDLNSLEIIITSVVFPDPGVTGDPTVAWSDGYPVGTPGLAVGSSVTDLPTGVEVPGGSVIMSQVTYDHPSIFDVFVQGPITLGDTFYVKPRLAGKVDRVTQ